MAGEEKKPPAGEVLPEKGKEVLETPEEAIEGIVEGAQDLHDATAEAAEKLEGPAEEAGGNAPAELEILEEENDGALEDMEAAAGTEREERPQLDDAFGRTREGRQVDARAAIGTKIEEIDEKLAQVTGRLGSLASHEDADVWSASHAELLEKRNRVVEALGKEGGKKTDFIELEEEVDKFVLGKAQDLAAAVREAEETRKDSPFGGKVGNPSAERRIEDTFLKLEAELQEIENGLGEAHEEDLGALQANLAERKEKLEGIRKGLYEGNDEEAARAVGQMQMFPREVLDTTLALERSRNKREREERMPAVEELPGVSVQPGDTVSFGLLGEGESFSTVRAEDLTIDGHDLGTLLNDDEKSIFEDVSPAEGTLNFKIKGDLQPGDHQVFLVVREKTDSLEGGDVLRRMKMEITIEEAGPSREEQESWHAEVWKVAQELVDMTSMLGQVDPARALGFSDRIRGALSRVSACQEEMARGNDPTEPLGALVSLVTSLHAKMGTSARQAERDGNAPGQLEALPEGVPEDWVLVSEQMPPALDVEDEQAVRTELARLERLLDVISPGKTKEGFEASLQGAHRWMDALVERRAASQDYGEMAEKLSFLPVRAARIERIAREASFDRISKSFEKKEPEVVDFGTVEVETYGEGKLWDLDDGERCSTGDIALTGSQGNISEGSEEDPFASFGPETSGFRVKKEATPGEYEISLPVMKDGEVVRILEGKVVVKEAEKKELVPAQKILTRVGTMILATNDTIGKMSADHPPRGGYVEELEKLNREWNILEEESRQDSVDEAGLLVRLETLEEAAEDLTSRVLGVPQENDSLEGAVVVEEREKKEIETELFDTIELEPGGEGQLTELGDNESFLITGNIISSGQESFSLNDPKSPFLHIFSDSKFHLKNNAVPGEYEVESSVMEGGQVVKVLKGKIAVTESAETIRQRRETAYSGSKAEQGKAAGAVGGLNAGLSSFASDQPRAAEAWRQQHEQETERLAADLEQLQLDLIAGIDGDDSKIPGNLSQEGQRIEKAARNLLRDLREARRAARGQGSRRQPERTERGAGDVEAIAQEMVAAIQNGDDFVPDGPKELEAFKTILRDTRAGRIGGLDMEAIERAVFTSFVNLAAQGEDTTPHWQRAGVLWMIPEEVRVQKSLAIAFDELQEDLDKIDRNKGSKKEKKKTPQEKAVAKRAAIQAFRRKHPEVYESSLAQDLLDAENRFVYAMGLGQEGEEAELAKMERSEAEGRAIAQEAGVTRALGRIREYREEMGKRGLPLPQEAEERLKELDAMAARINEDFKLGKGDFGSGMLAGLEMADLEDLAGALAAYRHECEDLAELLRTIVYSVQESLEETAQSPDLAAILKEVRESGTLQRAMRRFQKDVVEYLNENEGPCEQEVINAFLDNFSEALVQDKDFKKKFGSGVHALAGALAGEVYEQLKRMVQMASAKNKQPGKMERAAKFIGQTGWGAFKMGGAFSLLTLASGALGLTKFRTVSSVAVSGTVGVLSGLGVLDPMKLISRIRNRGGQRATQQPPFELGEEFFKLDPEMQEKVFSGVGDSLAGLLAYEKFKLRSMEQWNDERLIDSLGLDSEESAMLERFMELNSKLGVKTETSMGYSDDEIKEREEMLADPRFQEVLKALIEAREASLKRGIERNLSEVSGGDPEYAREISHRLKAEATMEMERQSQMLTADVMAQSHVFPPGPEGTIEETEENLERYKEAFRTRLGEKGKGEYFEMAWSVFTGSTAGFVDENASIKKRVLVSGIVWSIVGLIRAEFADVAAITMGVSRLRGALKAEAARAEREQAKSRHMVVHDLQEAHKPVWDLLKIGLPAPDAKPRAKKKVLAARHKAIAAAEEAIVEAEARIKLPDMTNMDRAEIQANIVAMREDIKAARMMEVMSGEEYISETQKRGQPFAIYSRQASVQKSEELLEKARNPQTMGVLEGLGHVAKTKGLGAATAALARSTGKAVAGAAVASTGFWFADVAVAGADEGDFFADDGATFGESAAKSWDAMQENASIRDWASRTANAATLYGGFGQFDEQIQDAVRGSFGGEDDTQQAARHLQEAVTEETFLIHSSKDSDEVHERYEDLVRIRLENAGLTGEELSSTLSTVMESMEDNDGEWGVTEEDLRSAGVAGRIDRDVYPDGILDRISNYFVQDEDKIDLQKTIRDIDNRIAFANSEHREALADLGFNMDIAGRDFERFMALAQEHGGDADMAETLASLKGGLEKFDDEQRTLMNHSPLLIPVAVAHPERFDQLDDILVEHDHVGLNRFLYDERGREIAQSIFKDPDAFRGFLENCPGEEKFDRMDFAWEHPEMVREPTLLDAFNASAILLGMEDATETDARAAANFEEKFEEQRQIFTGNLEHVEGVVRTLGVLGFSQAQQLEILERHPEVLTGEGHYLSNIHSEMRNLGVNNRAQLVEELFEGNANAFIDRMAELDAGLTGLGIEGRHDRERLLARHESLIDADHAAFENYDLAFNVWGVTEPADRTYVLEHIAPENLAKLEGINDRLPPPIERPESVEGIGLGAGDSATRAQLLVTMANYPILLQTEQLSEVPEYTKACSKIGIDDHLGHAKLLSLGINEFTAENDEIGKLGDLLKGVPKAERMEAIDSNPAAFAPGSWLYELDGAEKINWNEYEFALSREFIEEKIEETSAGRALTSLGVGKGLEERLDFYKENPEADAVALSKGCAALGIAEGAEFLDAHARAGYFEDLASLEQLAADIKELGMELAPENVERFADNPSAPRILRAGFVAMGIYDNQEMGQIVQEMSPALQEKLAADPEELFELKGKGLQGEPAEQAEIIDAVIAGGMDASVIHHASMADVNYGPAVLTIGGLHAAQAGLERDPNLMGGWPEGASGSRQQQFMVELGKEDAPTHLEGLMHQLALDSMEDVRGDDDKFGQEEASISLNMAANMVKLAEGVGVAGVSAQRFGELATFDEDSDSFHVKDYAAFRQEILAPLQDHGQELWDADKLDNVAEGEIGKIQKATYLARLHADTLERFGLEGHDDITAEDIEDFPKPPQEDAALRNITEGAPARAAELVEGGVQVASAQETAAPDKSPLPSSFFRDHGIAIEGQPVYHPDLNAIEVSLNNYSPNILVSEDGRAYAVVNGPYTAKLDLPIKVEGYDTQERISAQLREGFPPAMQRNLGFGALDAIPNPAGLETFRPLLGSYDLQDHGLGQGVSLASRESPDEPFVRFDMREFNSSNGTGRLTYQFFDQETKEIVDSPLTGRPISMTRDISTLEDMESVMNDLWNRYHEQRAAVDDFARGRGDFRGVDRVSNWGLGALGKNLTTPQMEKMIGAPLDQQEFEKWIYQREQYDVPYKAAVQVRDNFISGHYWGAGDTIGDVIAQEIEERIAGREAREMESDRREVVVPGSEGEALSEGEEDEEKWEFPTD